MPQKAMIVMSMCLATLVGCGERDLASEAQSPLEDLPVVPGFEVRELPPHKPGLAISGSDASTLVYVYEGRSDDDHGRLVATDVITGEELPLVPPGHEKDWVATASGYVSTTHVALDVSYCGSPVREGDSGPDCSGGELYFRTFLLYDRAAGTWRELPAPEPGDVSDFRPTIVGGQVVYGFLPPQGSAVGRMDEQWVLEISDPEAEFERKPRRSLPYCQPWGDATLVSFDRDPSSGHFVGRLLDLTSGKEVPVGELVGFDSEVQLAYSEATFDAMDTVELPCKTSGRFVFLLSTGVEDADIKGLPNETRVWDGLDPEREPSVLPFLADEIVANGELITIENGDFGGPRSPMIGRMGEMVPLPPAERVRPGPDGAFILELDGGRRQLVTPAEGER